MRRFVPLAVVVMMLCAASATRADNAFYRVLAAKPNATIGDAVRGFHELAVGPAQDGSLDKQAQALADRKIIKSAWRGNLNAKLTRGRVAYMICTTCGIKGGLTMSVFGPSERYAFRECVFLGVWEGGTQRDYLTGGELLGLLKWAADYLEEHPKQGHRPAATAAVAAPDVEAAPDAEIPADIEETPPDVIEEKPTVMPEPKPVPAPVKMTPDGDQRYVVQKGDTFANISVRFYGTSRYDGAIMKVNSVDDPWAIRVGQTLVIPGDPTAVK